MKNIFSGEVHARLMRGVDGVKKMVGQDHAGKGVMVRLKLIQKTGFLL